MHAILGVLARWNNFRYLKLEPSLVKFFDGEKMSKLINTLLERKKVSSGPRIPGQLGFILG